MKTIKINLGVILFLFSLMGCNNKPVERSEKIIDTSTVNNENEASVKNKVLSFLKWYEAKHDTLTTIVLVHVPDNDKEYYSINFSNTEAYLTIIKESGFFTKEFIEKKRIYFRDCDSKMKNEKQNDGPPIGLEYDLLILTQEVDNSLLEVKNMNFSDYYQETDSASINAHLINTLKFHLKKNNNSWLIDEITLAN